jgi:hypothetical protein
MFALVQQTFLAKKPCKNSADLHPRKGNLVTTKEHFTVLHKTSPYIPTTQNRLETS